MRSPPITRAGAQRAARHELAKAIYHRQRDPLMVRAVKAAGHWVSSVVGSVAAAATGGGPGIAVLLVLLGVVALVLWWRVGPLRRSVAAAGAVLPVGRAASAAEHRALAEAAAARGDNHTAVLERMRAVTRALEERGVIDPRPGRTAVEVAEDGGHGMPSASPLLVAAAHTFDAVVYGGQPAASGDVEAVRAADRAVARR